MASTSSDELDAATADVAAQLDRVRLESDTLYAIIGVVASSPDLNRVLGGIVDLLTEATECHACFVYLREQDRLVLRAASRVYSHLVGGIEFGLDEGLTGWVARHKTPAFIRDEALSDPRMKYVPEIEEEHFQSMVAVPVPARSGEVNGVIVLHTRAPREFDQGALNFLVHTASLVAGAIENAQLYEDARRRVDMLTGLSALGQRIASVASREALYATVTQGVRALLGCDSCRLYLLDADGAVLESAAADPPEHDAALPAQGSAVLLDLMRQHATGRPAVTPGSEALLAAPVAAGDEQLGVLAAQGPGLYDEQEELLRAVAHQAAIALQKVNLIERLTAENIVRDLFTALAAGNAHVAEARARAAGCDLSRPHVVIRVEQPPGGAGGAPWPSVAEGTEARLRLLAPGAVVDAGADELHALLPLQPGAMESALEEELQGLATVERLLIGISAVRPGVTDGRRSLVESTDAAKIARALMSDTGGALAYRDLGAYRYLVRVPPDEVPDDRHRAAIDRLLEYDRQRRSQLVATLEQYLRDRSRVATARALYIHPNTLRQRLERIEALSGLDLEREDLVSLELAVKLARLRAAART
jgi:GAF domain-containing protein